MTHRIVLLFSVDTTYSNRAGEGLNRLGPDLREQLAALPGVISASYSSFALVQGWSNSSRIDPVGPAKLSADRYERASRRPRFLQNHAHSPACGEKFQRYKTLQKEKSGQDPHIAVINESFARRFFGKKDPVGQHFRFTGSEYETEIVGVVGDAKFDQLRNDMQPTIYVPIDFTHR